MALFLERMSAQESSENAAVGTYTLRDLQDL